MTTSGIWWFERPTPAVEALHRALARGCGGYLVMVAVLSTAWSLSNDGTTTEQVVSLGTAVVVGVLALVVWSGRRTLVVPATLLAVSWLAQTVGVHHPEQGSPISLYTTLGVVLLLPTQLRTVPAFVTAVLSSALLVLSGPSAGLVLAVEIQLLTFGALIAEIGFLRLLFASAHELDRVAELRREQVVAQATADAERAAMAEARSVLHDHVIGALLLLRHGGAGDEAAQERAAEGLAALRRAGMIS